MSLLDKIRSNSPINKNNELILKAFGVEIEKGEKDINKLEKKIITVTRNGRTFQMVTYVNPETGEEVNTPVGEELSPTIKGMNIKKYFDKAILITGDTYVNIDTLHKIKAETGIGGWNKTYKGWFFPISQLDVVLGNIYSNIKLSNDLDDKAEGVLEQKNAYKIGTKVKGKTQNGEIIYVHYFPISYDIKVDDGSIFKGVKESLIQVLPETDDKKIAEKIQEAVPENRNTVEIEINGTTETPKTIEEVVAVETNKTEVSLIGSDYLPKKKTIVLNLAPIDVVDYTDIPSIQITLAKDKNILAKEKSFYIPDIDEQEFKKNGLFFDAIKMGENKYLVALNGYAKRGGSMMGDVMVRSGGIETSGLCLMSLDLYAATTKYYRAKLNVQNKKEYEDKGMKVKRLKMLSDRRATYSHINMFKDVHSFIKLDYYKSQFWEAKRELVTDLKQKSIDMELQMEDLENAHSKGRETSYGDSNTKDDLLKELGVKVKRQNGDEINTEEIAQIKEQLQSVYSVFGDRSEMSKKWGLKISNAGSKAMHAMKAQGVFFPHYNAIGVSFGNSKNKEGGFTLAHEFAHFMDYWIGKKNGSHFGSDKQGSLSNEIASIFRKNMKVKQSSTYQNRTCECFARSFEQYYAYKTKSESYNRYIQEDNHVSKEVFETRLVPLIEKYLTENNTLLKSVRFKNLS